MSGHLMVLKPGPAVSLQDRGRPGYAHLGISPSGAMDPRALALANLLCGNPADEAALELGLWGCSLQVEATAVRLALTGANLAMTIDGRPAQPWRSHLVRQGQTLRIGGAATGVWAYLAVAGGFAVEPVLGSRSTHWRSGLGGLGGRRLEDGDRLELRRDHAPDGRDSQLKPIEDDPSAPIHVMLGPQEASFGQAALETFLGTTWRIGRTVDRMGYRLEGAPIEHAGGFNIVSDGIVRGSIQVPGNGQPVVMMADHQTTGGYPKIATVISADLPRLAQMPPGAPCRFAAVDLAAALAARRAAARLLAAARASLTPVPMSADLGPLLESEHLLRENLIDGAVTGEEQE